MKKTFAFVLAIILLCPVALADTLREQVNAPMEHKGTYNSPSGKSHIYVDAQVIVPEAETIPIYQAFARVPDEMEFKLLAEQTIFPDEGAQDGFYIAKMTRRG